MIRDDPLDRHRACRHTWNRTSACEGSLYLAVGFSFYAETDRQGVLHMAITHAINLGMTTDQMQEAAKDLLHHDGLARFLAMMRKQGLTARGNPARLLGLSVP